MEAVNGQMCGTARMCVSETHAENFLHLRVALDIENEGGFVERHPVLARELVCGRAGHGVRDASSLRRAGTLRLVLCI